MINHFKLNLTDKNFNCGHVVSVIQYFITECLQIAKAKSSGKKIFFNGEK